MDDRPYGARFIDEIRRLTQSTLGLEYAKLQRYARMDRAEFMAEIGDRLLPPRKDGDATGPAELEPEALARAIVDQARSDDAVTVMINVLGGLV